MRLHLLCSASTSATRDIAFPDDEPVDDLGRKGLSKLSGWRPPCDEAVRSPALCAAQTACGLALEATRETALRECDFGRWTGRRLEEVHVQEPDALACWMRDPAIAPHGGESMVDVRNRVGAWMDGLPTGAGSILAITHTAVIRAAIAHALDAAPASIQRIDVSPLGVATLTWAQGRWRFSALIPLKRLR